ncbi:MAG: hypothetical protein ACOX28_01055 [Bacilli bacterium]|jgi:hypothetical protein
MRRKRTLISTLIVGVAVAVAPFLPHKSTNTTAVKAAEPTTRRVYAVLKEVWFHNEQRMYIHYWGGDVETNWDNCPQMSVAVDNYWKGMFFFDVPANTTGCIFKSESGNVGENDRTVDFELNQVFNESLFRVAWVEKDPNNFDYGKRQVNVGEGPMDSLQFAGGILSRIDTCSNSYANGYNSYKQIMDCFYNCSEIDDSIPVEEPNGNKPTIGAKLAMMKTLSLADKGSASALSAQFINKRNYYLLAFVGISLAIFGGALIFKRRKVTNR